MTILRLLVPTVAALALSATASAAGPCTQQIAQVQAQIAPGGEVDREGVVLKVFDLKFGVRQTLRY